MSVNIRLTLSLHLALDREARVRDHKRGQIRAKAELFRTIGCIVDRVVVLDDSLLLPLVEQVGDGDRLVGRNHHGVQRLPRQAIVIRVKRVTIDLSVKHIGRNFERLDLRNERIWQASELLIELDNLEIVLGKLVHEHHLLHFSIRQAPLKIREVWAPSGQKDEFHPVLAKFASSVLGRVSAM